MSDAERYRQRAVEAREQEKGAVGGSRESWRAIADGYDALAKEAERREGSVSDRGKLG